MRRVFNFHFNKPASNKAGKPQITVHYKGICHIVNNIEVFVTTYGHINKTQPRFVMKGYCDNIVFKNGVAKIV